MNKLFTLATSVALTTMYSAGHAQPAQSGLTNVVSLACGIPVNDGNVHTVATAPAGSCFYGVTTLAGLASITINGATPFSFLTDSGNRTGPLATAGSANNPFTSASGAYRLTDASVPNLDIAWLAIQAARLTGKEYDPAGTYIIGSAMPLPLMTPLAYEGGYVAGVPARIVGDGPEVTVIKAGIDFGTGVPLAACGDPSATVGNNRGRFNGASSMCFGSEAGILYEGPGAWFWANGTTLYQMDGYAPGARHRTIDVAANGFNHDWLLDGDHTTHIRPHATGGAHGFFWDGPNTALQGDFHFVGLESSGESFDAIEVAAGASIAAQFDGETYLSAPYAVRGDSSPSCNPIVSDAQFNHLMAEYVGYAVFADETGFIGGSYNDTKKCRSLNKLMIHDWYWSFDNSKWISNSGRQRRAVIDANDISGVLEGIQADTAMQAPNIIPAPSGQTNTPVAIFNVRSAENALGGLKISGNLNGLIAQAGTLAFVPPNFAAPTNVALEDPGVWAGGIAQLYAAGNYTVTSVGDLLEPEAYQGAAPAGTNYGSLVPALGVAMQAGLVANGYQTGQWVPYASSGIVMVNIGWSNFAWGAYTKGTGIGAKVNLVSGSGYKAGTYSWTAAGGGCSIEPSGTVTVNANGSLSGYAIVVQGTGCSSSPSIAIPAAAGLGAGGVITPMWPGALAVPTSTLAAPVIGVGVGMNVPGNGKNQAQMHLLGMQ